jgi:hypothetical protein
MYIELFFFVQSHICFRREIFAFVASLLRVVPTQIMAEIIWVDSSEMMTVMAMVKSRME